MEQTTITVVVHGGLVEDVTGIPKGITVRVEDYDVDACDDDTDAVELPDGLAWVSEYGPATDTA